MAKNSDEPRRGPAEREDPDRDREEVPGRPAVSQENLRQQEEEGNEQQEREGRGGPATRLRRALWRLLRGRDS